MPLRWTRTAPTCSTRPASRGFRFSISSQGNAVSPCRTTAGPRRGSAVSRRATAAAGVRSTVGSSMPHHRIRVRGAGPTADEPAARALLARLVERCGCPARKPTRVADARTGEGAGSAWSPLDADVHKPTPAPIECSGWRSCDRGAGHCGADQDEARQTCADFCLECGHVVVPLLFANREIGREQSAPVLTGSTCAKAHAEPD